MVENKKGGKISRIGLRFFSEIEKIKDIRLKNGKSNERIATEKITNLIINHKFWRNISEDIMQAEQEEIDQYGK